MTDAIPDRITVRNFSTIFEKMCNFVAVAKIGDPQATIRGLVKLCIFEFPDELFDSATSLRSTIETLFGLTIPNDQIQAALDELEKEELVIRPGNTNYRLKPAAMAVLKQGIDDAQALEKRVKDAWFGELECSYPDLPADEAWQVLRAYLSRTFRRHGIQAAALLDPTVDTPVEHQASLTLILHDAIDEHDFGDKRCSKDAEAAISSFMAALGTDPDRVSYIVQLADGAFNFYTLEVRADLSEEFRHQLSELTLFLDTNFLFGILDLHHNTQVQVSHDLLRAINEHKFPFKLRFHEATQREMTNTLTHYGRILRSRAWSRSLSRAAATSHNLSGIEQEFHKRNADSQIDVEEFLHIYEHFDHLLAEKDIKVFRPSNQRMDAQNNLFHEYQEFLAKNGRGDKPYDVVMHDAKVLEETRNLRSNAESSLNAGALLISCDYFLYRFDWETSCKAGHQACVLLPNVFWQVLRPFVPTDQDFEKAFAETFALPEFRAIGSGGSRACSKMLQILATYKDVPEETAKKMLANKLLLERLRSEQDDVKFEEQVEAAFVEENRNLLEERAALEQEIARQKALTEEECRRRREDRIALEAKSKEQNKVIEETEQQLDAANRAVAEHERVASCASQQAQKAQQAATKARVKTEDEARAKGEAQRKAFRMSVFAGFAFAGFAVTFFLVLVNGLPWSWLISHTHAVSLQATMCTGVVFASIGVCVKAWRKWCFTVGVLAMLVTLLPLLKK